MAQASGVYVPQEEDQPLPPQQPLCAVGAKTHGSPDLQRPVAAAAAGASKASPRSSPPSAEWEAVTRRNRANVLSELRSLSTAHLVTETTKEKTARLETTMRTKRRRHESDTQAPASAAAASAEFDDERAAMEQDEMAARLATFVNESVVDELENDGEDEEDSDVVTVVTISTPIHTPARSPAPSRRTPPAVSVSTVVVPPMTAQDEADLRTLRAQGLVTAALRERSAASAAAPVSQGRDAELLQSLRQDRRVTGLLGQTSFVRTLEATLLNRPASGAARVPPRRRTGSGLTSEQPAPMATATHAAPPAPAVPPTDPRLNAEIQNEIVFLTRAAPVTRMLQSEQRQVLEILIRHRIERQGQGRPATRSNPAGVLLRQAHRLREQPGQQRMDEGHAAAPVTAPTTAPGPSAGAQAVTISVLQAQIRIMTEQMAEMARMVTATYQLQQDMQRTMNQQVAAVFHAFQAQAEYTHPAAAAAAAVAAPPMFAPPPVSAPAHAAATGHAHGVALASAAGAGDAGGVSLGNCVICTQQVDTVLYRCGHMCVCGLCARQLKAQDQWCPMCRAPIDDIVRVFPN